MKRTTIAIAIFAQAALALATPLAAKEAKHIVVSHFFIPKAAWAPETSDAYVLMRAGCLESLTRYEGEELVPNLAESWTRVDDKTWDFKIRNNVNFQDNAPLDANAVVGSLKHVLQAATPPRGFNPSNVSSVEAVDPMTVRIVSPTGSHLLPYRLAVPNTGILSPNAYKSEKIDIFGTCTGPFKVVEDVPKQHIRMERNEAYWGEKPKLDSAEMRFLLDGGARLNQLRSGEAHIVMNVPLANVVSLESEDEFKISAITLPRMTKMIINNSRAPFTDERVRQALQHAIDVEAITAVVFEGYGVPAVGPFGPGNPWAPADAKPAAFDPEKAKQLLADAGVDPSELRLSLMAYSSRPELPTLAAVIQEQLGKIGIGVDVQVTHFGAMETRYQSGDFDLGFISRSSVTDSSDPSGYLVADYTCKGTYNLSNLCDAEIDKKVFDAIEEEDDNSRYEKYAKIAEEFQESAVSIYIVHEQQVDALSKKVKNYAPDTLAYYLITPDLDLE